MERIKLSAHFNYKKLFQFVLPSILMMVFVSVYSMVDGFFVSNYVGVIPFSALNLIFPLISILGAIGFMLGAGGNAVVSKLLGAGEDKKANEIFSMLICVTVVVGVFLAILGIVFAPWIAELFASAEKNLTPAEKVQLVDYCVIYARIILAVLPMFMLQNAFQGFFVTAEKPKLGLFYTLLAGGTNILLDWLFVVVFHWGLVGAALATAISQSIGGILPLFYFFSKNDGLLRLGKTKLRVGYLLEVCINGSSELITNISLSIVAIVFNKQLMVFAGIAGVSAYGIMQYFGFVFIAVFLGYSVGISPVIGFHYGAKNHKELKNIFKKSQIILAISGVIMTLISSIFGRVLAGIFVSYDQALLNLTTHGLRIYAFAFLVAGLNIFSSAFFTALSNGLVSFVLSFLRTFLFQIICVLLLPCFFGVEGVWWSLVIAEILAIFVSLFFYTVNKKKYGYM